MPAAMPSQLPSYWAVAARGAAGWLGGRLGWVASVKWAAGGQLGRVVLWLGGAGGWQCGSLVGWCLEDGSLAVWSGVSGGRLCGGCGYCHYFFIVFNAPLLTHDTRITLLHLFLRLLPLPPSPPASF